MIRTKPVKKSQGFFEIPTDWEKHWKGMPEFVQVRHNEAYCEVIVRLRTKEDLEDFARVVEQSLTKNTKTIWYPKLIRERVEHKKYVSEEGENTEPP